MADKLTYPFWKAEAGKFPTKESDAEIATKYYDFVYQQDGIKTLADVQEAVYSGIKIENSNVKLHMAGLPFYGSYPDQYGKIGSETQRQNPYYRGKFEYLTGPDGHASKTLDAIHCIGHLSIDAAHSMTGETQVAIAETAIFGKDINLISPVYNIVDGKLKPALDIQRFQSVLEYKAPLFDAMYSEAKPYTLDKDYEYKYHIEFNKHENGKINLSNSPQVLKPLVHAALVGQKFKEQEGHSIGEVPSSQLVTMPKEKFRLAESDRQQVADIIDYHSNPQTQIQFSSLTSAAKAVSNYIDKLKESALSL